MPSCQAPSCLTAISTEVEKSPHSILLAESDKKHMPNCQGLWRNDLHFLTALFYAAIFCKWPQALHLHCHLERSCLSVSGQRVLGSMKTLSREISPYHGASSRRSEISPPCSAFVEMTRKRGEQLCQFAPCQWRMGHLLSDRLTIWKGLHHFFHSPCILRQRRRHPLRLMNPGRRAALQSQICYFNSIKNDVKFFNSTCWVKNESNETSTIKAGILTYELLR